jgi:hypothetical protein
MGTYLVLIIVLAIVVIVNTKICGDLDFVSTLPKGIEYCSRFQPIGFYTCKQLLLISSKCNALIYANGRCTILQRGVVSTGVSVINSKSIKMIRLTKDMDTCEIKSMTPNNELLFENANLRVSNSTAWNDLPLLGLVMTVTHDWMAANQQEVDAVVSNFNCYADVHNYKFVSAQYFLVLLDHNGY